MSRKNLIILSSKPFPFTTNFTTNSPQQLAPSCRILPRCQLNHTFHKSPKSLAKQGIPGQNKEKQNNDKSAFYLPRHSSFTINHTFANLGNTGHNMAQTLVITTVSTTKAHGGRARVAGEIGHIP